MAKKAASDRELACHRAGRLPPDDFPPTKPFWGTRETILKQMGVSLPPTKRRQRRQKAHMNHSIHSADRSTHLKIVAMQALHQEAGALHAHPKRDDFVL